MIEPQKWASALGSLSDTVTLPDEDLQFASFKKLFPALTQVPLSEGGIAPQRTDFNTLFKLLGDNIFYIQQGGVFSYSDSTDYEKGAFIKYNNELYLCIKDNSSFNKHAPTDAEYWQQITTNDILRNYVRSVNGVNADDNGNVSITSVNHATNADHADIADSATKAIQDKNGAQIDTTYFKSANGTFTGGEYFRDVNNSVLRFNGGNTHDAGAALMLFGKNAENAQGIFDLAACSKEDASDSKQLIGTPAGSLTWAGKEIERVELKGSNYIRFVSGLTLMWGVVDIPAGTKKYTVNLPIPFNSKYQAFLSNLLGIEQDYYVNSSYGVTWISLSAFAIQHTLDIQTGWSYLAVGY